MHGRTFLRLTSLALLSLAWVCSLRAEDGDAGADRGDQNPVSETRRLLQESFNGTPPALQAAAILSFERTLDQTYESGKLVKEKYLEEKNALARNLWDLRRFDDAVSMSLRIIDQAPSSVAAAKAWSQIGIINFGNRNDPRTGADAYAEAIKTLSNLPDKQQSDQSRELLANSMSFLGTCYFCSDQRDKAIAIYQDILADEQLVAAAQPSVLLNANLKIGRFVKQTDPKAAQKYFDAAYEITQRSEGISLQTILGTQIERLNQRASLMSKAERIKQLEKIWNDKKFRDSKLLFSIGNELSMHHYFSDEKPPRRYFTFAKDFLTRIRPKVSQVPEFPTTIDHYYRQNLILFAQANRLHDKKPDAAKITREFIEHCQRNSQVHVMISGHIPGSVGSRIHEMARALINDWKDQERKKDTQSVLKQPKNEELKP